MKPLGKGKQNLSSDKTVIIRTDGGICSQIAFAALGKYFEDKGCIVKYDLDWFRRWGKGLDGRFVMNFDMLKAFPEIPQLIASEEEIKYFKEKYLIKTSIHDCTSPVYIDGYPPEREINFLKYREYYKKYFNPIDKDDVKDIEQNILSSRSCAVHVRRGDLSNYNVSYGHPAPVEYFIKAMKIIKGLEPDTKFFFFSDECDWVKKEIIPKIDSEYEICDKNGTDKGYLDLYLMTKCDNLISSQGSLAKSAKILSDKNPILVLDKYLALYAENLENVIILNDTAILNKKSNQNAYVCKNQGTKKKLSLLKTIFSVKNSEDNNHKIITLLGINMKFKVSK